MRIATNLKVTLPVAKAADFRGYSIAGLWRIFARETGSKYSYATFHAVTSGRIKVEVIEDWLATHGYQSELEKAQSIQNRKQ